MKTALLSRSVLAGLLVLFCNAAPAFAQQPPMPPKPTTDVSKLMAGEYVLDKTHANVIFKINHLGFSTYYGRFNALDAKLNLDTKQPEKSSVEVTVDVSSVDTNNAKLQDELKGEKYFNVAKFPAATFKSTKITRNGDKGTIDGDFTMLGVTKPITLNVVFHGGGKSPFGNSQRLGFDATTTIKRAEWGLNALEPLVGDDVQLEIETEFTAEPPAAPATPVVPAKDEVKKKVEPNREEKYLE
ncbi:MAG: YceI family protein [Alphaproteobacteria bacterium]|nr:YceI family protein [Alphaproteobacteria bacterium]